MSIEEKNMFNEVADTLSRYSFEGNPSPASTVALDMAADAVDSLEGMNRRIDRTIDRQRHSIITGAVYLANLAVNRFDRYGPVQQQLFSEFEEAEISERTEDLARRIGTNTLTQIESYADLPDGFCYKNKLRLPFERGKVSAVRWIDQVWAPEYVDRISEAAMLGLTKESAEVLNGRS